ncbi:MAG: L,D-transpeptidase family protein [Geminicoccaceae bacterium]
MSAAMAPTSGLSRRAFNLGAAACSITPLLLQGRDARAGFRAGDLIGEPTFYVTQDGETLLDIARERNLGVPEISAVNPGVDPWVPAAETLLTLPTQFILPDAPRKGIVVNYGDLRLYHFAKDGSVETFAIGVGRDGFELKFGQTKIVRKKEKPTWYPTESVLRDKPWVGTVVPPGPDNPLGEYALYLGWPTYVIHGTNKPYGVGRRVSRGCIRMYPEGVERLFAEIPVGTPVTAVNQVTKLGWRMGELYLEAQPDFAQIDELEENQGVTARPVTDEDRQRIIERAGAHAARIDWVVAEAELIKRRGLPVQITRPQPPAEGAERVLPPTAEAAEARPNSPMSRGEGGIY